MQSMAKLTDTQKDEGADSFVNFVITKMIFKDHWVDSFVIRKILFPLISTLTNEPPVRWGWDTDSFDSARVGDTILYSAVPRRIAHPVAYQ